MKIKEELLLYAAQNAARIADDLLSIYNIVKNDQEILREFHINELNDLQITLRDWKDTSGYISKDLAEKSIEKIKFNQLNK